MLLGKAQNPSFWSEDVRNKPEYASYRNGLLTYWEKNNLDTHRFEAMTYSEFKLFWTTGDRAIYERQYFSRRTAMEVGLPLSLIYPEEPKYIERLMDWVYIVCDEYTWCLPAHQNKLDPLNETRIDLFASECAFNLAVIYTLLGDRLDPLIRAHRARVLPPRYRAIPRYRALRLVGGRQNELDPRLHGRGCLRDDAHAARACYRRGH